MDRLITSRRNPKIKAVLRDIKQPSMADCVVVEGEKLVDEALRAGLVPVALFTTQPRQGSFPAPVYQVTPDLFRAMTSAKNPQPPLALFRKPKIYDAVKDLPDKGAFVLLDQIQDPGNGGALVRAAVAFGMAGVIWHEPCLHPFHPKCIRASAGAVFKVPHYRLEAAAHFALPLPVLTTGTCDAVDVNQFAWPKHFILGLGNEGHGMSGDIRAVSQAVLRVSFPGDVESLNVTGAAYIILFCWAQQKIRQIKSLAEES